MICAIDPTTRLLFWICVSATLCSILHFSVAASLRTLVCSLACIPVFAGYHALKTSQNQQFSITHALDEISQPCVLSGTIISDVRNRKSLDHRLDDSKTDVTRFDIRVQKIRIGTRHQNASGHLHVILSGNKPELHTGCEIVLLGKVKGYAAPTNPGEVDRSVIHRRRGFSGFLQCYSASAITITRMNTNPFYGLWNHSQSLVDYALKKFFKHLKRPNAEFASALALGCRELLDQDTKRKLLVTGTAHMLSVSGLHLGLVVWCFNVTASMVRMRTMYRVFLIVAICVLYSFVTGLRPPVLRSSAMVITCLAATGMNRSSNSVNSLFLCALIFISCDCMLLFDMGVQLSFLAVGTLLTIRTPLRERAPAKATGDIPDNSSEKQKNRGFMKGIHRSFVKVTLKSMYLSTALFAVTAPFLWFHFNLISPISILTNLLIGPLLVFALLTSLILPLVCLIHDGLGGLCGIPCNFILDFINGLIDISSEMKNGHYWLPSPTLTSVICFYLMLSAVPFLKSPMLKRSYIGCFIGTWILFQATQLRPATQPDSLDVVFLNVGHGTSVVLQLPNHQNWLYDCGSLGQPQRASKVTASALWELGISRLDALFISHADSDHYNGIWRLLDQFIIDGIYTTRAVLNSRSVNLKRLFDKARFVGAVPSKVGRGDHLVRLPDHVEILHPPEHWIVDCDNGSSLVLKISYGGYTLVLPGDIEGKGMRELISQQYETGGTVVMAPHHGSLTEETKDFIQWSDPFLCVISGRRRPNEKLLLNILNSKKIPSVFTYRDHAIRVRLFADGTQSYQRWNHNKWQELMIEINPAKNLEMNSLTEKIIGSSRVGRRSQ
ncbi:MAG: ComEC/Rec2 family competence protein [Planctomycetota bacterium]|nr:ComEC/Rec2 family competence protein [Planctomycetota bacterium]